MYKTKKKADRAAKSARNQGFNVFAEPVTKGFGGKKGWYLRKF
jgi:hypothetical protein